MTIQRGIEAKTASRRIAALFAVAVLSYSCQPGAGKTAYVGGTVLDATGGPPILDAVIVVADGKIEAIGPPDVVSVPRGAEEIRLDGRWVIPGLIDGHAHAERWMLNRFLAYGVTSVRDMGGAPDSVQMLREETSLMSTPGPRMYISGAMIDGVEHPWPTTVVRTDSDARQAVDRLVLIEAAQAKIFTRIDRRLLGPLMDEALVLNLPVTAHLGKVDAVTAVRMGVRSLEHMSGVVEATVSNPARLFRAHNDYVTGWNRVERTWASLDSAALERTARAMVDGRAAIVPTLVVHETHSRLTDAAYISALDLTGVPDGVEASWDVPSFVRSARLGSADFRAFRRSRPAQDRFVRQFSRAGGLVVAGSDAGKRLLAPGASLHDELALLVRAGLEPREALLTATRNAAQLLDADSLGVLVEGAVADFVVLTADPLADIANARSIQWVISRGTRYHPEDLRAEW